MNNNDKIIKCRVKSDSTFTDLAGIEVSVKREKAFYRIVGMTLNKDEDKSLWDKYYLFLIGREQLDLNVYDHRKELAETFKGLKESGVYSPIDEVDTSNPPKETGTGSVREFESGAKRDVDGKEDYVETQSFLAMKRYAEYMTVQAKKYGRGNWRKGIPIEEYEKSLMRHIHKYFANKYDNANLEPEIDHLSAIRFNLDGIMHEEERLKLKVKNGI